MVSEQELEFLFIPWVLCAGMHAVGVAPSAAGVRVCVRALPRGQDVEQEMATHALVKTQSAKLIRRHVCIFGQLLM